MAAGVERHRLPACFDVPAFDNATTYPNPNVDALTFRDETGAAVKR
jgi:hypothetical protein